MNSASNRRQWLLAVAAGLAAPGCSTVGTPAGPTPGTSGTSAADTTARTQLAPSPLDNPALVAAAEAADLHSLLVWQRGSLLHSTYRTSRDKPGGDFFARDVAFGPDVLHDLRSISKSVVALLVGQAVGRGQMDIGAPVLDFYPQLADLRARPGNAGAAGNSTHADITLAHLLHMASGLTWDESGSTYGAASNDETRLYFDGQPARYILDRPLAAMPGSTWNYNGGNTWLLADVLRQRTGRTLLDLAGKDLFEPLGITRWEWRTGTHGQPLAYAGLRLTPPDLLKIGRLVLAGGLWDGRQVVPAAWVAATLQPRIAVGPRPSSGQYGHQWWHGTVESGGETHAWTGGVGNGGQRLYLVPALGLAVVMTAGQYNSGSIGGKELQLFRQIAAQL